MNPPKSLEYDKILAPTVIVTRIHIQFRSRSTTIDARRREKLTIRRKARMSSVHSTTLLDSSECWPVLRLADWKDTYATLHMWTQIVGKIRLELTPRVNHWWNVPLYVSPHGLTTSLIPHGNRHFDMEFDFHADRLMIRTTDARSA